MNYWQGEKILLRAIEPSDWEIFVQWNLNSESSKQLDFLWPPQSRESVKVWALEQSRKKLENDAYFWVIENKQGIVVGSIDTYACNHRTGSFSYGVAIMPEHQRKGYASEAIGIVLRYYFLELRYQKVTESVHSNNTASIGLHEKLGFIKEGSIRRVLYNEGQYYDNLLFGMTKEEFLNTHR